MNFFLQKSSISEPQPSILDLCNSCLYLPIHYKPQLHTKTTELCIFIALEWKTPIRLASGTFCPPCHTPTALSCDTSACCFFCPCEAHKNEGIILLTQIHKGSTEHIKHTAIGILLKNLHSPWQASLLQYSKAFLLLRSCLVLEPKGISGTNTLASINLAVLRVCLFHQAMLYLSHHSTQCNQQYPTHAY